MQENELKEYQRLRAEGRWPQASEFREAERQRLRSAGRSKQQACDESWAAMLVKFPPLEDGQPANEPPPPSVDPNSLPDVIFAEDANYKQAVRWALRAIGLDPDKIPARQITNPACLAMLRFAQTEKGRERFFLWVKQLDDDEAESQQVQRTFKDDQRTQFKLLDKLLEYWRQHPEADATQLIYPPPRQAAASEHEQTCPTCQGCGTISTAESV